MSELYLVLRHRLESVTEWVTLGTATMLNARKALGYSYETMGRKLNVAAKTYERWEKKGRVPRHVLPKVADVLELEIDQPARQRVTVAGEPPAEDDELVALIREVLDRVAALDSRFAALERRVVRMRRGAGA